MNSSTNMEAITRSIIPPYISEQLATIYEHEATSDSANNIRPLSSDSIVSTPNINILSPIDRYHLQTISNQFNTAIRTNRIPLTEIDSSRSSEGEISSATRRIQHLSQVLETENHENIKSSDSQISVVSTYGTTLKSPIRMLSPYVIRSCL